MKKIMTISGIFLGGIIVGATLMNLLDMYVRPIYREVIRTKLQTEQEFLAGRATRQNDKLKAVLHRWNVVDLESGESFRVFRKEENKDIDSSFLFPFYMLPIKFVVNEKCQDKGGYALEAVDRGYLAAALEALGENAEATRQWEQAQTMLGRKTLKETREFILTLLEQEKSDLYMQAEKKVLGDANQAHPTINPNSRGTIPNK